VVGARALRGSSGERVLLLAALLYLPVPLATALVHWDPRYFLPLHALSAAAITAALAWGVDRASLRWWSAGGMGRSTPWVPVSTTGAMVRSGPRGAGSTDRARVARLATPALALAIAGWMIATATEPEGQQDLRAFDGLGARAADWLVANAPPGSVIVAHYRQTSWLRFRSGGALTVWTLPTQRPLGAHELVRGTQEGRRWLTVGTYGDGGVASPYSALEGPLVLGILQAAQARYLVLTGGYGPTSLAFLGAFAPPDFREVYRDSAKVRGERQELVILEVARGTPKLAEIPVTMTPGTLRHLQEDLGEGSAGLEALTSGGVRLDLREKGTLDLAPGGEPNDTGTVRGWLVRGEG
jgi:hypothetical protein